MPDGYEVANHLNPLADDAAGDKDTDGVPNWNEYVANTGADDPDSFLQIIDASGTAAVNLVHPVATGRVYTLLFADRIVDRRWDWQTFGNTNVPVGAWIETNPAATTHAFVDDFGPQTSGSQPTNAVRAYGIRVAVPAP